MSVPFHSPLPEVSRRKSRFLRAPWRLSALAISASLLAACGTPPPADSDGGDDGGSDSGGTSTGPTSSGGETSIDNSGGGSSATGGTTNGGGGTGGSVDPGPCPAQPVSSEFALRWEDDFDSFDTDRWSKGEHSFDINLARFSQENATTEDGYLKLFLTNDPSGEGDTYKAYRGAEVHSLEDFQYGRFDVCARWGTGYGVVASFFTYLFEPWNEIDVEYLGYNNAGIQYNIIWNGGNSTDPHFDPLDADLADAFHQYSMEWVPGEIRFYVDGMLRHTASGASAQAIDQPVSLRMNLWISDSEFAGGGHHPDAVPTESWYDWVRVYDYVE